MHFVLNPFGENSAKRRKSPDTCNPDILSHIIGKSDKLFPCAKTMPPRIWKDKAKRAEHVVFCGTDKIEFEVELTNPIAIMGIINRANTIHKATKQLIRDVDNMHSQLLAKAAAAETQSCGERIVDAGVEVLAAGASVVHERAGKVVSALATLFKEVYGAVEDSKTLSAVCCFPAARTAVVDNMYLSFCAGVCADVHVAPPTATLAPPTPTAQVPADSAGRRDTAHALHGMAGMFLAAAAGAAVPVPASKPATQGDDDTVIAQATHAA